MLRINTEIILDNGIVVNWLLLTLTSIRKSEIELTFDAFVSKDLLDKVVSKKQKLLENKALVEEFVKLEDSNDLQLKNDLQEKINKLADEVECLPDYNDVVISTFSVTIPYSHNNYITKEFIIEKLKESNLFKIEKYE